MRLMTRFATICFVFIVLAMGLEVNAAPAKSIPSTQKQMSPSPSSNWQKKWDDTVAEAKKEGELLIYLNAPSGAREALSDTFYKKFGIKVDVVMGSGQALTSRLISEYQSGINQVDVFIPGATSILLAGSYGFIAHLEPKIILPDVRNPKNWLDGRVPFYDKEGMILGYLAMTNPTIIYNSDIVKAGEITSHSDLLKPRWKGQTIMYDPTIGGAGLSGAYYLSKEWGNERVYEYITAMIKKQDTLVTKDMRQQAEWVARGKYKVALWSQFPATSQILQAGAPLAAADTKERNLIGPMNGAVSVPTKPKHPNAAIIFLNWFLSREGQTIAAKAMGAASARVDVPTEGVNPMYLPKKGEQYNIENEESTQLRPQFVEGLKKVFDQLNK